MLYLKYKYLLVFLLLISLFYYFPRKHFSKLHTYTKINIFYTYICLYILIKNPEINALNKDIMFIEFRNV